MRALEIVLQIVLGLGFLMFGAMKFGAKQQVEAFRGYGYPQWFRIVTGVVELMGAVAMLAGIWNPVLAVLAGLLLAITMLGAVVTHLRARDPGRVVGVPMIILILSVIVSILNGWV